MRAAASLLALVLAAPAAAESPAPIAAGLTDLLAGFASPEAGAVLAAGYAACLAGDGQAAATAAFFAGAGWARQDDPEMGTIDFAAPDHGLTAMIWDSEGFCMVDSATLGTDRARAELARVTAAAGLDPQPVEPDAYCPLVDLRPGLRAELTSSGQDPVCDSDTDSAVRFTWTAG